MKAFRPLLPLLLLALGACARGEHLSSVTPVAAPRRSPGYETRMAGTDAAAAAAWDAAGSAALRTRMESPTQLEEILAFPSDRPVAVAYRISLQRGEEIEVTVKAEQGPQPWADIFEVIDTAIYRHVYSPAGGVSHFTYRATTTGDHVLRIQPQIGTAGRYDVRLTGPAVASLTFPIAGGDPASIGGYWGDARDGGARDHKGVDIFAPRGTPVIAVAAGTITKVETTATGGRVIWERDASNGLLYFYAHLDEQIASAHQVVSAGDTIGLVGNTGNASGGSTHLHFGVFNPDYTALNPTPYLQGARIAAMGTSIAPAELGTQVKLAADHVRLRSAPAETGHVIEQLDAGTDLLLVGFTNGWTRVLLRDGTTGFVAARLLDNTRGGTGQRD